MTTPVLVIDSIPLKGRMRAVRTHRSWRLDPIPWAHGKNCECEAHETFTCDRCGRRVGYCLGAHDNMPGACDFCWKPR